VSGFNVYSPIADNDGVIRFSHSDWPADVFTVVEDASYVLPTPTPTPTTFLSFSKLLLDQFICKETDRHTFFPGAFL
jgi:hypothetical protein